MIEVQNNTLSFDNGQSQAAEGTIRNDGLLSAGSSIYLTGGRLSGNGAVSAVVVNAAKVSPGGSTGMIIIVGSYTQTGSSDCRFTNDVVTR